MAKLRMTTADYVAIAISPALIMALVGSLVFFLIEVLYVGDYQARLIYVFGWFVFATVLIGRISIELGSEQAFAYSIPLAIVVFLALMKFVEHPSAWSPAINLLLIALVWWSSHKLTRDCTLVDDSQDASGEGLMQRLGVDELPESEANENELFAESEPEKPPSLWQRLFGRKSGPHPPGLWVLYFSLAALPLFGIGQRWIPAAEMGRRRYAFALLAVYVAAGLSLLVSTSFLGLRRYLRQRRIEMPTPMAATWILTGGVLIALVMLLAALVPRPNAEVAISQVPWQVSSPGGLQASRASVGGEGADDEDASKRRVTDERAADPGDEVREDANSDETAASDSGEKQTAGQGKSDQGEKGQQGKASQSNSQSSGEEEPESAEVQEQSNQGAEQSDEQSESTESKPAETPSASRFDTPHRLPDVLSSVGGMVGVLKLLFYAAFALLLLFLAWRSRKEIAAALVGIWQALRNLLAGLFGGKRNGKEVEAEQAAAAQRALPRFSDFTDPFLSGRHANMSAYELVQYTFTAFEAWARDRGHPRSPDQTPLELVREVVDPGTELSQEARRLTQLYSAAAYAPGRLSAEAAQSLRELWALLRSADSPAVPIKIES